MQQADLLPVTPDSARIADGDAGLAGDARSLHRSLSELIRLVQFRDRDRICCHDVSVSQCYALESVVRTGPLTVNRLADSLYLDKSTTSRLVDGLEAKDYVLRRRHPDDGRAVLVEATAAGRQLHRRIESELIEENRRVLSEMDAELRAAVVPLLDRLVRTAAERIARGPGCEPSCCEPPQETP